MTTRKTDPIPTRFDEAEDKLIRKINAQTGLSMAEIIRRAVRFVGPKFDNGEINILNVVPETRAGNQHSSSKR
jgi:hypothetical protein